MEFLLRSVERAIAAARDHLQALQDPQGGFWVDELEADSTLTSEYMLWRRFLGEDDATKERKATRYLLETQQSDGGWTIYPGGKSEISATAKAYFALKLMGVPPTEPAMVRARRFILDQGGLTRVNVFTKVLLALFGQYPWRGVPCMPVEIILLPSWFIFNLYAISYWSRTVLVPLLIIFTYKPRREVPAWARLDELFLRDEDRIRPAFPRDRRLFTWRNFFLAVDRILRVYDAHPLPALRRRAIAAAHRWMGERMRGEGGLGAIYPAMANSVIALRCLGYPSDHPLVRHGLRAVEQLEVEDESSLHMQPCFSPIWDTCLAVNVLLDAGLPPDHPALVRACRWLVSKQVTRVGDWQVKVPTARPGGWYFQFENEFYPDVDDTAVVLMALGKVPLPDDPAANRAIGAGRDWMVAMQSREGGWGAFDKDNNRLFFNHIPFADHGALLDPPSNDVTGRAIEALAVLGASPEDPVVAKAIRFIREHQEPLGGWYGRWGVNYIYGTWSVLSGLEAIGENMQAPYVKRAAAWLIDGQNADGGWGESCVTYNDPATAGCGESTASQTAWALIALLRAGLVGHQAVERGVRYLLATQGEDGGWDERRFTGTGFPRVFYLRYHMYCKYFPLWALTLYRKRAGMRTPIPSARRAFSEHPASGTKAPGQ